MASGSDEFSFPELSPTPHPSLRQLDRLVGAWDVSGDGIAGTIAFAWLEGGFFLTQAVDLVHDGRPIKGIEIIGYDPMRDALTSNYYGNQSAPFPYEWERAGDTLTIWGGGKGSPAKFTGQFSPDGAVCSGAWEWPGGGYASTMTRRP